MSRDSYTLRMSNDLVPDTEWSPDDPRVLFQRVVDDILDKIERGELYPNALLPSARKMADSYGLGVMTIQRALRELQQLRVTYSIAGKGTFIHPDITDLRKDADKQTGRVAGYLDAQRQILDRYDRAETAKAKNDLMRELLALAQANRDLLANAVTTAPTPGRRTR